MDIITVDFETYYAKDFSLTKLTTEEYIRSRDFEVIGLAVKVDEQETEWFSGTHKQISVWLNQFDWDHSLVLAHNTQFDGAILNWHFGITPMGWLDTLCMARAVHGVEAGGSLAKLAERYAVGVKGTEVNDALGKRRIDFAPDDLDRYGEYCRNDVELTHQLCKIFIQNGFPKIELKVIDVTLRMFIEPELELDLPLLEQHLQDVKDKKDKLLEACVADKDTLMSNDKFAYLLIQLGVTPPVKVSPRTGKEAWAFAKTDEGFKALQSHTSARVQALVAARLGNKTTLEETRTQRLIDIAKRGKLPVPIKYYAAHTGRWGGEDKINLQNLPSRGANANRLKKSIVAPEGYVVIDSDSSQIEARVLAWLSGQQDLVNAFENKEDVYKIMASQIYGKPADEVTDSERFVGKTTILGCGYGMGAQRFQDQLKIAGVELGFDECLHIIDTYRKTFLCIPQLWDQAQACISGIYTKSHVDFGAVPVLEFSAEDMGFKLPNGLWQRYDTLTKRKTENNRYEFVYTTRKGNVKLYGGKLVENLCQAIARCVIAEQMIKISKRYKVVLTVHDAVACIALKEEAVEAQQYVELCMRWRPKWAETLPLNCESGMGNSYGDC